MDRAHFRQHIELMFQGMLTDMREAEARCQWIAVSTTAP
jgi:hypothetical protein